MTLLARAAVVVLVVDCECFLERSTTQHMLIHLLCPSPRLPSLPSLGTGESGSLDLGGSILAELQDKIAEKQESVQTKAKELDELEARLAQAEARKQALEAKGVRM